MIKDSPIHDVTKDSIFLFLDPCNRDLNISHRELMRNITLYRGMSAKIK